MHDLQKSKLIYVSAIYASPPGTMGGNTKILIEMCRNAPTNLYIKVFTTSPETFYKYVDQKSNIEIIPIVLRFRQKSYLSHIHENLEVYNYYKKYMVKNGAPDFWYSCSDFATDVLPVAIAKWNFRFKWIASLFLFIPSPFANLKASKPFPLALYTVYYLYQKLMLAIIERCADKLIITNKCDIKSLSILTPTNTVEIPGGVNIDQLTGPYSFRKNYDLVFCGRIHYQKGLERLIRALGSLKVQNLKLKIAVIGTGDKEYVSKMHTLAKEEGVYDWIEWLGYCNDHEKYEIYSQSRALIHPTLFDNNGMVAAEALCFGIPVIAYKHDALVHLYGKNIYWVELERESHNLASAIKFLTFNPVKIKSEEVTSLQKQWAWSNILRRFYDIIN